MTAPVRPRPPCPGCGDASARGQIFCAACWADIPAALRRRLDAARKAVAAHPTRQAGHAELVDAIATAASCCQPPTPAGDGGGRW